MACRLVEEVTGYTITIQSFQWGYREGTEYLTRELGETGAGVVWRQRIPHRDKVHWSITFDGSREMAEQIRTLTYLVMQYGGRVQFFPEAGTRYYWIDWQETLDNSYLADWRHEITLDLRGELPFIPAVVSQAAIEVLLALPKLAFVTQAAIEVLLELPRQALTSQAAIETLIAVAPSGQVSQGSIETFVQHPGTVSVSQAPIEVLQRGGVVSVAQGPIEVWMTPGV